MRQSFTTDSGCVVVVETGLPAPPDVAVFERKGLGHPDTLADHLAEALSKAYSKYTRQQFGAILHHNFDKLCLLGGSSEVRYGGGRMTSPVRVLVNGRAARSCGGTSIPVDGLIVDTTRSFFHSRLPEIADHLAIELNVTTNASPGAVHTRTDAAPERISWFAPSSLTGLRERKGPFANDTSLGTGWAPANPFEDFGRTLVNHFSHPEAFPKDNPWCGSDVKLMGYAEKSAIDLVICVPQKAGCVPDRQSYLANKAAVREECLRLARKEFPSAEHRVQVNARDIMDQDELYLTYSGSSIESGDEGVVGRGNRVNGLITPLRPMNLEGVNGKNPVYHVGKLYNVAAMRSAQRLHEMTDGYAEVHLISATGRLLSSPWRVLVRLQTDDVSQEIVREVLDDMLDQFSSLTDELVTTVQHLS